MFGKFAPIESRPHPAGNGVQHLFRFSNGYGASVVKTRWSYGGSEGLWELGVIRFDGDRVDDYHLTYETPITDDVLGGLSDKDVARTLRKIARLK